MKTNQSTIPITETWKSQIIEVEEHKKEWLQNCLVGNLRDLSMYDKLQDMVFLGKEGSVKPSYLGDNLCPHHWAEKRRGEGNDQQWWRDPVVHLPFNQKEEPPNIHE